MIQLQDVVLTRSDRVVLKDINISIEKGQHWGILGKNGSGKTTILEMIAGYIFPTKGTVRVNGYKYGECDIREVRKKIGYISQSLLDKLTLRDPVWEVVATGEFSYLRFYEEIPADVIDQSLYILEQLNIFHLKNQPLGSLSQGERKKVLLARALMTKPSILILDEPCSGLDIEEREKFLDRLNILKDQDMTIVYVTHHIDEILPLFTHVTLLDQGRIISSGEKKSVLQDNHLTEAFHTPISIDWIDERPWLRVLSR
ncbi:ABC transporter ATP-binding protein [Ammoniphilus sp. 3BR4]|uniref:ABC transporter ATP-binding protein n=1 Tax=Ammoniphilus sp. 3BR4 TaxID=3158265 RepID=UPI00346564B4